MRVTPVGDDAIVSGRIVGARRATSGALVTRRHACGGQYARVGSVRVGSDGRFRARIPRPTESGRVTLRAQARLRGRGATYSLPQLLRAR